ncbi:MULTISPECIES: exodeoxyribonuclease VII large subunit [unclassified Eubacterium (in: firmicutes)]|uniref:exodeoxyribonuclease VII large subunit n=1 Tax=unclassified Eubacterium (in: firmicutes) TaxID=2624479 RepID=UPI000334C456|nr:exodeoxyribonuclease VII large subunit [Eubacterium sp. AF17-7]RGG64499.1 exodeoxyribonuclease VII large subunit [Eubacterium sp. AF17-7]CDA29687.1 exodeoxyribonuclease 7 large subunit [Eubacterium sp. CAG:156]
MKSVYSVSQVNSYIKNMFTQDFVLNSIYIKGEVSNCKYHTSGHIYFSLKDKGGVISGVMFAGNRGGLNFTLKEGQDVIVLGSVSVYEKSGAYQVYAKQIMLDGAGQLYQKYEELKKELEEMGMFDIMYKQPIPKYATKIGICTASTGAAIQDIRNISSRRNPYVQLYLYPAIVQGENAAASIVQGLRYLDEMDMDVIIVGRGGGSIEDLWAFNEEAVARTIFNMKTPVISAVGHETDTTIADYVADLRAPTPSAAAELAVFDYNEFKNKLFQYKRTLENKLEREIQKNRILVKNYEARVNYASPKNQLLTKKQYVDELFTKMENLFKNKLTNDKHTLGILAERLNGLSPLNKLSNGYAYITDDNLHTITSVGQIDVGEKVLLNLKDGKVTSVVEKIEKGSL